MAFVTRLHLQASADAALSCKPERPVFRGNYASPFNHSLDTHSLDIHSLDTDSLSYLASVNNRTSGIAGEWVYNLHLFLMNLHLWSLILISINVITYSPHRSSLAEHSVGVIVPLQFCESSIFTANYSIIFSCDISPVAPTLGFRYYGDAVDLQARALAWVGTDKVCRFGRVTFEKLYL